MDFTPAIRIYLREISGTPLLTADDEVALAQRIELGCMEARELFIKSNLRLVASIAKGYNIPTLPFLDLVSEGNIGLMKAIERFDWRRGCRFSAVAVPRIHEAIKKAITDQGKIIRLPSDASKRILGAQMVPMDEKPGLDSEPSARQFPDEDTLDPIASADIRARVAQLKIELRKLPHREQIILLKRYDLPIEDYVHPPRNRNGTRHQQAGCAKRRAARSRKIAQRVCA